MPSKTGKPLGRRPGPACGAKWGTGHKGRCARPPKVEVTALFQNKSQLVLKRCWVHYLAMEELSRRVDSPIRVLRAKLYLRPDQRKEEEEHEDIPNTGGGLPKELPDR